nr:U-box domain-containing protein 35-like [Ipomoea batatas]
MLNGNSLLLSAQGLGYASGWDCEGRDVDGIRMGRKTSSLLEISGSSVFSVQHITPLCSSGYAGLTLDDRKFISIEGFPFCGGFSLCLSLSLPLLFPAQSLTVLIVKEVIVEDSDVSKALVEYINKYRISNIVLGASTRSAIARKFWTHDVPTIINKTAPDFCSVYVISKGKQQSFRPAARPLACAPSQAQFTPPHSRPSSRNTSAELEDIRPSSHMRGEQNARPKKILGADSFDAPIRRARNSSTRNSLSDNDSDDLASFRQGSLDLTVQNVDFTRVSDGSNENAASKDLEAEMKRLKLELKQTMDMYNTACKEAVSAKQMAKQLQQSKMEEARRFEQARLSEEAALAMVEMEKAKCKAAIEAAEKAQKIAEIEAQRVKFAEMKAKKEAQEKTQALNVLSHDARYRKYPIEEIEAATDLKMRQKEVKGLRRETVASRSLLVF